VCKNVPFTVVYNQDLDTIGIDIFIQYASSKLGICLNVKSSKFARSKEFILEGNENHPYADVRIHNELYYLVVTPKTTDHDLENQIRDYCNAFLKKHKIPA